VALLITLHLALPAWWWVMVVPFSWGLARSGSAPRGFAGGAALGAAAWAAGVAVGWLRGAEPAATRIAAMLDPLTGSSVFALAGWTVAIGAFAAAVAGGAGGALARVLGRSRPGPS
jgi:hypothetical protein